MCSLNLKDGCVKDLLSRIQSLVVGKSEPPRPEDFSSKGEYIWARTIYRRFPPGLNEPASNVRSENGDLVELWSWANGENGIGLLKPGYKFLSQQESEREYQGLYQNAPVKWLSDLTPVFSAPNQFLVSVKESNGCIYAVNLSMGKAFLVAGSLSSYLTFVFHCLQSTDSDIELDPESYVGYEVDAAKDAGLHAYYPLRKNSETIISHVLD